MSAASDIVVGCVVENESTRFDSALRLVRSIRWFGGRMADAPTIVCCVDGCEPETRARLESLGASVRVVPSVENGNPFSSRLTLLAQPEIAHSTITLLLDCGTIVVQDPSPWLRADVLQAKTADLPTVPTARLSALCRHFGIAEPPASYRTTFDDVATIWYCNAGVLAMPGSFVPRLLPHWRNFVCELAAHPELLGGYQPYREQAALTLAYLGSGLAFEELPVAMNFPLHLTDHIPTTELRDVDPIILRCHRAVDARGYLRRSPYLRAQPRIEAFNVRQAREAAEPIPEATADVAAAIARGDLALHVVGTAHQHVARTDLVSPGPAPRVVWETGVADTRDLHVALDRSASSGLGFDAIQQRLRTSEFTSRPLALRGWTDCYVMPAWGVMFRRDGVVNPEASRNAQWHSPDLSALPGVVRADDYSWVTGEALRGATHLPGAYLLLHHADRITFGHWMMDCLLGAWVLAEDIRAGRLRLLAAPLTPLHRQTLEAIGVPASALVETDSDIVRCDYLIAPSCLSMNGLVEPSSVLRDCFRWMSQHCPAPADPLPRQRRIYLGRGLRDRRTMRNEAALIGVLETRGFAAVFPASLTIPQQVHLFREAECIVGPHGSGMINAAYMAEGRHVVEISPVIANPNFWIARLSAVLGLRYAVVVNDVAAEDCDETNICGTIRRDLEFRYDADIPGVLRALDVFGVR